MQRLRAEKGPPTNITLPLLPRSDDSVQPLSGWTQMLRALRQFGLARTVAGTYSFKSSPVSRTIRVSAVVGSYEFADCNLRLLYRELEVLIRLDSLRHSACPTPGR